MKLNKDIFFFWKKISNSRSHEIFFFNFKFILFNMKNLRLPRLTSILLLFITKIIRTNSQLERGDLEYSVAWRSAHMNSPESVQYVHRVIELAFACIQRLDLTQIFSSNSSFPTDDVNFSMSCLQSFGFYAHFFNILTINQSLYHIF